MLKRVLVGEYIADQVTLLDESHQPNMHSWAGTIDQHCVGLAVSVPSAAQFRLHATPSGCDQLDMHLLART
jgi:hypothetical protein